jgi:hypothetical protein
MMWDFQEWVYVINLVIHENNYINNNHKALNSFFIIYEKFIKTSYDQNIEPVKLINIG